MTRRRRHGSRPETAARRLEILDAAVEIFGAKGYTGGTLQDIADQVGMTHAGVLHHFGSKDQLLIEVLKHRDTRDVDHFESRRMPTGAALFQHLVQTAFQNQRRPGIVKAYAVLSAESVTEQHPGRPYFEQRYQELRRELVEAFKQACAEQEIDERRVADASAAILAVMDGLQVQWLLDPEAVELGKATQFAINAIVSAVLRPQEPVLPE